MSDPFFTLPGLKHSTLCETIVNDVWENTDCDSKGYNVTGETASHESYENIWIIYEHMAGITREEHPYKPVSPNHAHSGAGWIFYINGSNFSWMVTFRHISSSRKWCVNWAYLWAILPSFQVNLWNVSSFQVETFPFLVSKCFFSHWEMFSFPLGRVFPSYWERFSFPSQ